MKRFKDILPKLTLLDELLVDTRKILTLTENELEAAIGLMLGMYVVGYAPFTWNPDGGRRVAPETELESDERKAIFIAFPNGTPGNEFIPTNTDYEPEEFWQGKVHWVQLEVIPDFATDLNKIAKVEKLVSDVAGGKAAYIRAIKFYFPNQDDMIDAFFAGPDIRARICLMAVFNLHIESNGRANVLPLTTDHFQFR